MHGCASRARRRPEAQQGQAEVIGFKITVSSEGDTRAFTGKLRRDVLVVEDDVPSSEKLTLEEASCEHHKKDQASLITHTVTTGQAQGSKVKDGNTEATIQVSATTPYALEDAPDEKRKLVLEATIKGLSDGSAPPTSEEIELTFEDAQGGKWKEKVVLDRAQRQGEGDRGRLRRQEKKKDDEKKDE